MKYSYQERDRLNSPIILSIAGFDPTGGAGIQADIETARALKCRSIQLITCLTVQNTAHVFKIVAVDPDLFQYQAKILLHDIQPKVIKIGLIGDLNIAACIVKILNQFPHIPVIFDPILKSGAGDNLSSQALIHYYKKEIIPRCFLITPNCQELRLLTDLDKIEKGAEKLLQGGVKNIIVTATDDTNKNQSSIKHQLFQPQKPPQIFYKNRLAHQYHGSGCTFSMACACFIGQKESLLTALKKSFDFTEQCLINAEKVGTGQYLPCR